jgi:hypothetical protein
MEAAERYAAIQCRDVRLQEQANDHGRESLTIIDVPSESGCIGTINRAASFDVVGRVWLIERVFTRVEDYRCKLKIQQPLYV